MSEWQKIETLEQDGRQIRLKFRNGKTTSAPARLDKGPVEWTDDMDAGWIATHWAEIDPDHCPMCGVSYEGADALKTKCVDLATPVAALDETPERRGYIRACSDMNEWLQSLPAPPGETP